MNARGRSDSTNSIRFDENNPTLVKTWLDTVEDFIGYEENGALGLLREAREGS
jgi:hypothetical protein